MKSLYKKFRFQTIGHCICLGRNIDKNIYADIPCEIFLAFDMEIVINRTFAKMHLASYRHFNHHNGQFTWKP